jgi:hypothetical protein
VSELTSLAATLFGPSTVVEYASAIEICPLRLGFDRTCNLAAITLHKNIVRHMYDRWFHIDHTASLQSLRMLPFQDHPLCRWLATQKCGMQRRAERH